MQNDPVMEREAVILTRALHAAGFQALWAGGCVRDHLMGRTAKDIDIATDATPDEVQRLFPDAVEVGKAFGVIRVVRAGHTYDVATFRRDLGYSDGRRPDHVDFCSPEEDAQRRDFTINGMFYDPVKEEVLDTVGGRKDLKAGMIRAIGDPVDRFREDRLRMLRAVRFASTLNFEIEAATLEAVKQHASNLTGVSGERIEQEFTRLLVESPQPGQGLRMLLDTGLLEVFLPEVAALSKQEQPPQFHPEGDVFTHTAMMLDAMNEPSRRLAYSVLLHDIGKPPTADWGPGRDGTPRIRFNGHDAVGARMAEGILKRLRMSRADRDFIVHCVKYHMRLAHARDMRTATLRRLIGAPTFSVELELHRLDCLCSHGLMEPYQFLVDTRDSMAREPVLPAPWVQGKDLLALGLAEGPRIGHLLKQAYDRQLDGEATDRDALLLWLRDRLETDGKET